MMLPSSLLRGPHAAKDPPDLPTFHTPGPPHLSPPGMDSGSPGASTFSSLSDIPPHSHHLQGPCPIHSTAPHPSPGCYLFIPTTDVGCLSIIQWGEKPRLGTTQSWIRTGFTVYSLWDLGNHFACLIISKIEWLSLPCRSFWSSNGFIYSAWHIGVLRKC